jgi:hypothetical protein
VVAGGGGVGGGAGRQVSNCLGTSQMTGLELVQVEGNLQKDGGWRSTIWCSLAPGKASRLLVHADKWASMPATNGEQQAPTIHTCSCQQHSRSSWPSAFVRPSRLQCSCTQWRRQWCIGLRVSRGRARVEGQL